VSANSTTQATRCGSMGPTTRSTQERFRVWLVFVPSTSCGLRRGGPLGTRHGLRSRLQGGIYDKGEHRW